VSVWSAITHLTESKVGDRNVPVAVQQNVLRFQVSGKEGLRDERDPFKATTPSRTGTQLLTAHTAPAPAFYFTSDKDWQRRDKKIQNQ
jgi:hypothetical protein